MVSIGRLLDDRFSRAGSPGLAAAWLLAPCLLALCVTSPAKAEEEPLPGERVRVAASERYKAGRVHRFVLGGGYRDLWETEIEVPVLDLAIVGGGLEPSGRFGGLQTAVLGLVGADRRSYSFRGTDKDPSAVLGPIFKDTIVEALVQDQMAAQHPGGPLASGVLTEAAGVLTVRERMAVMPDDPALGKYREEFAGMVGTFFEFPQPAEGDRSGFAGATEIISHKQLYESLRQGDEIEVDVRAFLRARLLDILIGDFDRHRKQWRWARFPGGDLWKPIPEDRDMAFVRFDGAAQRLMKVYIPILQNYGPTYPFIKGLTLHGWEQDRWLLPHLSWSDWQLIIEDIQARLTDETIERAVAALPPEYAALDGERMQHAVRGRRDNLPEAARRYYEHLAGTVDIRTSDAAHSVTVDRGDDGSMLVEVRDAADPEAGRTLFRRRFEPGDTDNVTLYLGGGNDRVRVSGRNRSIVLRTVSKSGDKTVDDSMGGGTRVYDSTGDTEVIEGPRTRVDRRVYTPPAPDAGFVDVQEIPPRDWGSDTIPIPDFGYEPDVGVFLGAAVSHTRFGFRKDPWASKHSLGFGWAFEANEPRVRYQGQFRPENSKLLAQLGLQYSGIEVLRFYGFGNETRDRGSDRFFRARNQQFRFEPSLSLPIANDVVRVSAGPIVKWSRTTNGNRLIDQANPYGNNHFGLLGFQVNFQVDRRKSVDTDLKNLELPFNDNPAAGYPTSGFFFDATARYQPPVWDVDESYGSVGGSLSGYVSAGENARATLGLRVGGEATFGKVPYFDRATIGGGRFFSGSATNRGFRQRRFAGDQSVFGNADLRIVLGRAKIIVPSDFGLMGFFDVGRVFVSQENSDDWHPSGGGGVWISPLVRTNTISFSVARSPEETLYYLRVGFHY